MRMNLWSLIVMAILASTPVDARAQPAASAGGATAQEQFVCHLPGSSDRRIGIYRPTGGSQRCRVDYTRDGKTRSLWSSGRDYQFCVRKALEIVGLLEGVHFQCSPHTRGAAARGSDR